MTCPTLLTDINNCFILFDKTGEKGAAVLFAEFCAAFNHPFDRPFPATFALLANLLTDSIEVVA